MKSTSPSSSPMMGNSTSSSPSSTNQSSPYLYYFPITSIILPPSQSSSTQPSHYGDGCYSPVLSQTTTHSKRWSLKLQAYSPQNSHNDLSSIHDNTNTATSSSSCSSSPVMISLGGGNQNTTRSVISHAAHEISTTIPNCILELREKFQTFLEQTTTTNNQAPNAPTSKDAYLNKLAFLDEFFSPSKNRIRRFESLDAIFATCDRFLKHLVKSSSSSIVTNITNDRYPYLLAMDEIAKQSSTIPLLSSHEYCLQWFKDQATLASKYCKQEIAKKLKREASIDDAAQHSSEDDSDNEEDDEEALVEDEGKTSTEQDDSTQEEESLSMENYDDTGLKMLTLMFTNCLEDKFALFQKKNSKFIRKWFSKNIKELPNHVIDLLQKKRRKFLHYHHQFKLSEEDMNVKTLIDSDFEFASYLMDHTEDWKVLLDDVCDMVMYKSKESYSSIYGMKNQKIICTVPYSIENVLKTMLTNEMFGERNGMLVDMKFHAFQELDPNISSKKYSTVIQTSTMNYGPLFKKRALENVISTRAVFCGNEVQEVIHLYKTCSFVSRQDDSKAPVKVVVFGCRRYTKDDTNRTRIVDGRLMNMGGFFMNSDFVINTLGAKKMAEDWDEFLNIMLTEAANNNFKAPDPKEHYIWRTLCDYCRVHCKVDITKW
ncbi:hypothetical protein C9374_008067 [Naegleria lovaniensis]|uniref:Uncharacterized protein n=1 Tax=Naegleria lovaniensis TaxID=51637 RepID=A0AA88GLL2_NAELO|nr:uncharacterized protein C9374_008067 [Naegleria lovaniensis]KAG2378428.1 hypothetical protein C9374_008067 [Naegleria lovaniensis]